MFTITGVCCTLMDKAMQTFNSNPPQNHLDETTPPSGHQWERMNNAKKQKFI
jgi:hypothetical protein